MNLAYSQFFYHVPVIIRLFFAFTIAYVIWPRFIFKKVEDCFLEDFFSNFIKMVLLTIVIGYVLVLLKLFEMIMILFILAVVTYANYIRQKMLSGTGELLRSIQVWFFDKLDGLKKPFKDVFIEKAVDVKSKLVNGYFARPNTMFTMMFLFVFLYSSYIRLYDTFVNAAPPLSDAYTVLAWMKHIGGRVLFYHGGGEVYPRGFYFFLQMLQKFSFLDDFYVMRYAGPISCVFIVLGLYFVVSRFTENSYAGLVSASIYGIFGFMLKVDWDRQAATNSQEFALVFVLPVIFFFYKYMVFKRDKYFYTAFAGLIVVGFVHSLMFAYIGMAMGILIIYSLLIDYKSNYKISLKIAFSGVFAVGVSLIPLGIGHLMGIPPLESSANFLVSKITNIRFPYLGIMDIVSITCLLLMVIIAMVSVRNKKCLIKAEVYIILLAGSTFLLYYFGGPVTKSEFLSVRTGELWALMEAVLLGFGWSIIFKLKFFKKRAVVYNKVVFVTIVSMLLILTKPVPIVPYKMEWNSGIEQYLRISKNYPKKTWAIVYHKEGYAVALGKGYHMYIKDFIKDFNPAHLQEAEWEELPQHIFIYQQKNVFRVSEDNSIYQIEREFYEEREYLKPQLQNWIDVYIQYNDNLSVFYEDENLRILHIEREDI